MPNSSGIGYMANKKGWFSFSFHESEI